MRGRSWPIPSLPDFGFSFEPLRHTPDIMLVILRSIWAFSDRFMKRC